MGAVKRLKRELNMILANTDEMWTAEPRGDEDLFNWVCTIKGPKGSFYEGGVFYLDMVIPQNYPFRPPIVKFLTKIYHPDVNESGSICSHCFDILGDNWSPAITIIKIFDRISHLLAHPDFSNPIFPQVSAMYNKDKSLFYKTCREWIQKYAIEPQ